MSNYSIVELGSASTWDAAGKHFLDGELGSQFTGISVNVTAPGEGSPFWHAHSQIEEIHIFLSGTGEMYLDDEVVPVREGSVVRVGQNVRRALRALPDSAEPMRWLCVRAGGGTLESVSGDATLDQETPLPWA